MKISNRHRSAARTARRRIIDALLHLTLLLTAGSLLAACSSRLDHEDAARLIRRLGAREGLPAAATPVSITYPYDHAVFPPEIAAPTFAWEDQNPLVTEWLVSIVFAGDPEPIDRVVDERRWTPSPPVWETIKANTQAAPAEIRVIGFAESRQKVLSAGRVQMRTSTDPVNAAILLRQVPLPFDGSEAGFKRVRWRLGDIASYDPPATIMTGLPVCASCHSVSRDGRYISMEMNANGDSGAQFIAPVQRNIVLTQSHFMSWNDYPRTGVLPPSRGLFGRMSPSGRFLVATVNEISYAAQIDDIAFSQLFFPTYGVLAYWKRDEPVIRLLAGADDYRYVHANPIVRPDDAEIVFARAPTNNSVHKDIRRVVPHRVDEDIHTLNRKYPMRFDLYRLPFNDGAGGTPEPVKGASQNGMSNYFPRFSPDGRWIVFTRSRSGIMLQPDSELFIIPAAGGTARRMICNRSVFNSWHSWSPNGRWLLFSSKVNTPYTEIFLTHVDESGVDAPPVLLSRFSDAAFAANVPEFVNLKADAIHSITLKAGGH